LEQVVHILSLPIAATYALAFVFGTVGIIQLTGMPAVRAAYLSMGYPAQAYRLTGAVELLAACLLAISSTRPLGVAVAAVINFLAVALLLKNRKYLLASPGLVVMAALPLALLTVR
jgi:DoxX-like family